MTNVEPLPGVALADLRAHKLEATQRLLGATIAVSDEDWQEPVALPGWTRAHVATHLARNADAMRRLAGNAMHGTDDPMYPGDRDEEIERGSERTGLELQIDLDTSAGLLNDCFDQVSAEAWSRPVALADGSLLPLAQLPLARLFEVEVHHVDLRIGHTMDDIDDEIAGWLLQWAVLRMQHKRARLDVRISSTAGHLFEFGNPALAAVSGTPQSLLAWLTGRPGAEAPLGADAIALPAL